MVSLCLPGPVRFLSGPGIFPTTPLTSLPKVIGQPPAGICLFDPVPTTLRKTVSPALPPFTPSLINASLSSGDLPLRFKETVVTKHTQGKKHENYCKYSVGPSDVSSQIQSELALQ